MVVCEVTTPTQQASIRSGVSTCMVWASFALSVRVSLQMKKSMLCRASVANSSNLAAHTSEVLPESCIGKKLSASLSSSGDAEQERDIASAQIPLTRIHIENLQHRGRLQERSEKLRQVSGA